MLIQRRKILFGFLCPLLDICRTNKKTFLLDHSWVPAACIATQNWSTPASCLFSTLNSQIPKDIHKVNKKIRHLIENGCHEDARNLFDRLILRNTITWNLMISGHVKQREIAKARKLFDGMPQRDVVSWNSMITGYMSCKGMRYLQEGQYLFDEMPERDFISWNTMISGYAKNGKMVEALKLFDAMPEKNVVSWNAIISGFLRNGDVKLGIEFFKKMPQRDVASLSVLVSGLIQNEELDEAAIVLKEFGETGEGKEDLVHAYNTLIAGYGHKGKVGDARKLFDQIPFYADRRRDGIRRFQRNLVSWNSMIMCYGKVGDVVSARELFDQMVERDTFSWNTMISGYVHVSDMKEASKLLSRMPNPDILSWNSIISGFAESGNLKLAHDFFERMPQKNHVSWNSIIAGCEKNREYEGAIKHFIHMQAEGEKPDRHTLSSLLSVSAETVALHLGMQIHQLATKIVLPDIPLNNSLITMYSRCGAIVDARTVFDEMSFQKDVISWNAMIGGYASHGHATEALNLFELMKQLKVRPTYITFISVLHACAHAGFVDEGQMHFTSMIKEFGIEPRVEHFSSLVDIVGRHGNVEEAANIIKSMPMDPDGAVWGALLGACKVHNNVELAQVAAEALIKLEPESSGPYVLLCNMYVDAGRWDDANRIRMVMEGSNIKKERGYSKVDTG